MSILSYMTSFFYSSSDSSGSKPDIEYPNTLESDGIQNFNRVLISGSELDKVRLQLRPVNGVIPSPARNRPLLSKRKLRLLNIAQLAAIKRVKLKHITPNTKPLSYEHRHPVLRELLRKHAIVN